MNKYFVFINEIKYFLKIKPIFTSLNPKIYPFDPKFIVYFGFQNMFRFQIDSSY